MYKLILNLFVISSLLSTFACDSNSTTNENTNTDSTSTTLVAPTGTESATSEVNTNDFMELSSDMPISDYVGQKIWISGAITPPEKTMEHMMKSSVPGQEELNVCIDFNEGEQVIGYYANITIPKDNASHKFYGTVDKISGPGKGGENHTEYFINLVKVE